MSGTFSSLTGALSGLRYNRVAMDVASGNVANANTEGYTRRTAIAQAVGAPAVPALWSRWDGTAGGVEVGGIDRMVDPLLDSRSRAEHASLRWVRWFYLLVIPLALGLMFLHNLGDWLHKLLRLRFSPAPPESDPPGEQPLRTLVPMKTQLVRSVRLADSETTPGSFSTGKVSPVRTA